MLESNIYEELNSGILETLYKEYDLWDEHPDFERVFWVDSVIENDTNLGYWEWVATQVERLILSMRPFKQRLKTDETALFGFENNEGEQVVVTCGPDRSIWLYLVDAESNVFNLSFSLQEMRLETIRKILPQDRKSPWRACTMVDISQDTLARVERFTLDQEPEYRCPEYRCPDCGHEKVAVKAEVSVHLDKFGNSEDIDTTDPFFDRVSFAVCRNCGSDGELKKFSL